MAKNNSNFIFNHPLPFPVEYTKGKTILTVIDSKKLLIENYDSLIECKDCSVVVKANKKTIRISGVDLKLDYFFQNDCVVKGHISGITFSEEHNE